MSGVQPGCESYLQYTWWQAERVLCNALGWARALAASATKAIHRALAALRLLSECRLPGTGAAVQWKRDPTVVRGCCHAWPGDVVTDCICCTVLGSNGSTPLSHSSRNVRSRSWLVHQHICVHCPQTASRCRSSLAPMHRPVLR